MYGNNASWKNGGRGYETGRLELDHNCHAKEFGFYPIYHEEAIQRLAFFNDYSSCTRQ